MFSKLFKFKPSPTSGLPAELNPRIIAHYGIPLNASRLAYDPFQHILAIGTLDGWIKVIGDDNIEGLLISPKASPFKFLQFLQNKGFLVGVINENDVQVWDLELRCIASSLQWKSNITAFSVIHGTEYMYLGDEHGSVSVLQFNAEDRKLLQLPYQISSHLVSEAAGFSILNNHSIVGVLSQPCSCGHRVLFVYDNGIIVLWDITKDQLVLTRGYKALRLKDESTDHSASNDQKGETIDDELADKEISSLCWASVDGSILAVGYVDGDIVLWDLSSPGPAKYAKDENATGNVFKLQFLLAEKKFPVLFLNWSGGRLNNNDGGRLFIYGGDKLGTAEVLTILNLEWTRGKEVLRSVSRTDVTLGGSFADMILLHNAEMKDGNNNPSIFVLTTPGQLKFYDDSCLSALVLQKEHGSNLPVQYSNVIPTTDPPLTFGKLCSVHVDKECSMALLEMGSAARSRVMQQQSGRSTKWPLTGGLPSHLSLSAEKMVERIYLAGYQDGSISIWDATYPVLSPLFVLEPEVKGVNIAGSRAPVSALDFSSSHLSVAVGSDNGLVRLYILKNGSNGAGLVHVTDVGKKVHASDQGCGPYCSAAFASCSSSVCILRYTDLQDKLLVGFENGQVAMLDISSLSVVFLTETQISQISPIIAFSLGTLPNARIIHVDSEKPNSEMGTDPHKEVVLVMRKDSKFFILDSCSGNVISSQSVRPNKDSTAVSMHILEESTISCGGNVQPISSVHESQVEPTQSSSLTEHESVNVEQESIDKNPSHTKWLLDSQIVFCFTDGLLLCSLKSLIQDSRSSGREVDIAKSCCWSSNCIKDGREWRLILLHRTGVIEIRSLPNLEVVGESSLSSILRWDFRTNMDRTLSSTINGQIVLVNGCEFAMISMFAFENDFRIPESLPCLHDKVLESSISPDLLLSADQTIYEEKPSGILGLVKSLGSSKEEYAKKAKKIDVSTLKRVFLKLPDNPPTVTVDSDKVIELNIDDLKIDEPLKISIAPQKGKKNENSGKRTEREKLFDGGTSTSKPKQRSIADIKAKYGRPVVSISFINILLYIRSYSRFICIPCSMGTDQVKYYGCMTCQEAQGAAAAAMEAKNKLLERQEKLERLTKNSEELQSGAENFASLAHEIAKKMENRKWWQL